MVVSLTINLLTRHEDYARDCMLAPRASNRHVERKLEHEHEGDDYCDAY